MLFVHLARRDAISKIKRTGITPSKAGRSGRGVYCVPLTHCIYWAHVERPREQSGLDSTRSSTFLETIPTDHRSTALMWKWIFTRQRKRGPRPIAVVFQVPASAFPIDGVFELFPANISVFDATLRNPDLGPTCITQPEFVRDSLSQGFQVDLRIRFPHPESVGWFLGTLFRSGWKPVKFWDSMEFIVPSRVDASLIRSCHAMSTTNRAWKEKRRQLREDPDQS